MPRHLISDAHEWINEIPTIYYLAKPHVVHVLARSGFGAELPSVGLCLNASKAEARLDRETLLLGLLFVWGRIGFGLHPGLRNLGMCLKCACLSWTSI